MPKQKRMSLQCREHVEQKQKIREFYKKVSQKENIRMQELYHGIITCELKKYNKV